MAVLQSFVLKGGPLPTRSRFRLRVSGPSWVNTKRRDARIGLVPKQICKSGLGPGFKVQGFTGFGFRFSVQGDEVGVAWALASTRSERGTTTTTTRIKT